MHKRFFSPTLFFSIIIISVLTLAPAEAQKKKKKNGHKIKVLLIDGQSVNHQHWKEWTPVLLKQLDDSELFQINVATSPMKGESLDKFNPKFKKYDVVVTIYDGDIWSQRTQRNLEKYLAKGGGMVVIHAANNAFPNWEAYNLMVGIGGWGNRTEAAGPYVYIDNTGVVQRDLSTGPAGHHGPRHEFLVETRMEKHPIMKDLPTQWLHTEDELYDQLRGPAKNMEILASAYSDEKYNGTQRNEPMLMTIHYEGGRIFHTVMGHDKTALSCVGFMTTFIRGCEWAAGKKVTFEVPNDFPTEKTTSSRTY